MLSLTNGRGVSPGFMVFGFSGWAHTHHPTSIPDSVPAINDSWATSATCIQILPEKAVETSRRAKGGDKTPFMVG